MSLPESKRDRRIPIDRDGLQKLVSEIAAGISENVRQTRPVVTTCPVCQRPNPCPLHLFTEQVAHMTARGQ